MSGSKNSANLAKCQNILAKIAPDVSELTGVPIDPDKLTIILTDKPIEEHLITCLESFAKNADIPHEEVYEKYKKSKKRKLLSLVTRFVDLMVGGMYEKFTIVLPIRKVNKLSDRDLKIIIAHELVHYTQDVVAPEMLNLTIYKTQETLKELLDIDKNIIYSEKCPRCNSNMEIRNGRYGKFWGCCQYHTTGCRGSYNYWYKMDKLIKGDSEEEEALQVEMIAIEGYASYLEHILEQKYPAVHTEPASLTLKETVKTAILKILFKPLMGISRFLNTLMKDKKNQYIWGEGIIKYLVREKGCSPKFEDLLIGIREVAPRIKEVEEIVEIWNLKLDDISVNENIYTACDRIQELIGEEVVIKADSEEDFIKQCEKKLPGIFNESYFELSSSLIDPDENLIPSTLEKLLDTFNSVEDGGKLFYYVFLLPISRNVAMICDMIDQRYKQILAKFKAKKRQIREVVASRKERKDDNILKDAFNLLYNIRNHRDGKEARKELLKMIKRMVELDLKYRFYIQYRTMIRDFAIKVTTLKTSPITPPEKDDMFYKFDNYRLCPECFISMQTHLVGNVMTDVCPTCGIVFLDAGELNQLAPYKDFLTEAENISEGPPQDDHDTRKCPECLDHTMEKVNFLNDSGIILDFCSQCAGTVLDPNELPEIHDTLNALKKEHSWQNKILNFMHSVSEEK